MILRLPLRQAQGYIDSLFDMLDFSLTCPSYSQTFS
ncbi:transposase [Vibrio splendidus]